MSQDRLFPDSGCPFPIPTSNAERYRPLKGRGDWSVITGSFVVGAAYGVLRESGTTEHILLHGRAGGGFVVTARGWESVSPGKTVIIEPGLAHYYATTPGLGPWRFFWVHFFPPPRWSFLSGLPRSVSGLRVIPTADPAVLQRVRTGLQEAHALRQRRGVASEALAINALERALLWLTDGLEGQVRPDPRIRGALDAVLADPRSNPSVPALARQAGLSPSRFAHLFREQTGETPQQFVERIRLDTAAEWMRAGGRTISEIAGALGFSSPFYFSRRFKARFGCSPSIYQRGANRSDSLSVAKNQTRV